MERSIETKCLHLEETEGCTVNYGAISYGSQYILYITKFFQNPLTKWKLWCILSTYPIKPMQKIG